MNSTKTAAPTDEASLLDPSDWGVFSQQAHDLLDALIDHIRHIGDGPVWRPVPAAVKERLAARLPALPENINNVCADLLRLLLPYGTGNTHPRFFGWVHGTGTAGGMLAEMAAGAINANCGGRDHAAIYLERAVIDSARVWFGLPETAGGILVSGTSMANILGLAIARNHLAGHDVRLNGISDSRLVAYSSAESHVSLVKAMEILGIGRNALHTIPVDSNFRMDLIALSAAIDADRKAGLKPFCIIGTAGTVNTGAFDDLQSIAALCRSNGLWMHVDGAFGATAILAPELAPHLVGIDCADSIAFDFHKWLHVPYDAGCLLVRDAVRQHETFSGRPSYLASIGGLAGGDPWPCDLGIELSRNFRALKIWFSIKEHGTERLGAAIARNCAQAFNLAMRLRGHPFLRVMAPVSLNIVCCRYHVPGIDEIALDSLNARIVVTLQESGIAAPSTCRINGRLCIRICITNHRSRDSDFDVLIGAIEELGASLLAQPS